MKEYTGSASSLTCPRCQQEYPAEFIHICLHPSMQIASREDVQRLETKVDALIKALKAGAIGQWGN